MFSSGHTVHCSQGIPTGCAYIGFERSSEINTVRKDTCQDSRVTSADARHCFVPCGKSCCNAKSARPPTHLCTSLYDWEPHVDPDNIAKLARLGVNRGGLNKIMLTMCHRNDMFAVGD